MHNVKAAKDVSLLRYKAASLSNRFPTFRDKVLILYRSVEIFKKIFFFIIGTLKIRPLRCLERPVPRTHSQKVASLGHTSVKTQKPA